MSNDSYSTDNKKDVSVSSVPTLGKRDRLVHTSSSPDGITTSTYINEYSWEASDIFQERIEQWLFIRSDYCNQVFLTYACSRLWWKTATVLVQVSPTLGYTGLVVFVVGLACLGWVVSRKPANLAASALRLLSIALGVM